MALSHALHRKIGAWRKAGTLDESFTSEWAELKSVVILLIEHLTDQQPLLVSAAINGISLIGSVIKLPLPDRSSDQSGSSTAATYDSEEKMDVDGEPNVYSKSFVAQKILYLLRSAHSRPKIREEAAHCLGHLAIGDGEFFTKGNLNAFTKMIKMVRRHEKAIITLVCDYMNICHLFFYNFPFKSDERPNVEYRHSTKHCINRIRI